MRLWQKIILVVIFAFFLWLFDTYEEWLFFSINCLGNSEFWQTPMLALTQLADGNWILILGFLFFPRRQGLVLGFVLAFLISGAIVQIIKQAFPIPRPTVIFESFSHLCVPGLKHVNSSFPSGHATSTFVLLSFLLEKNPSFIKKIFYFSMACLMALSRVYVGVHFLKDVWAGAWLGFFVGKAILFHYRNHLPKTNYHFRGFLTSLCGVFSASYFLFWHHEKILGLKNFFEFLAQIILFAFLLRSFYYLVEWYFDRKLFQKIK